MVSVICQRLVRPAIVQSEDLRILIGVFHTCTLASISLRCSLRAFSFVSDASASGIRTRTAAKKRKIRVACKSTRMQDNRFSSTTIKFLTILLTTPNGVESHTNTLAMAQSRLCDCTEIHQVGATRSTPFQASGSRRASLATSRLPNTTSRGSIADTRTLVAIMAPPIHGININRIDLPTIAGSDTTRSKGGLSRSAIQARCTKFHSCHVRAASSDIHFI